MSGSIVMCRSAASLLIVSEHAACDISLRMEYVLSVHVVVVHSAA